MGGASCGHHGAMELYDLIYNKLFDLSFELNFEIDNYYGLVIFDDIENLFFNIG